MKLELSEDVYNRLSRKDREAVDLVSDFRVGRQIARYLLVALALAIVIIWTWRLVSPRYTLYKANIERQVQVADARSKADAASLLAESEIERAKGVAEANRIIADSITPEYTTWLYVDQLDEVVANGGQIIYIPTEAGIPVLEAGRVADSTGEVAE